MNPLAHLYADFGLPDAFGGAYATLDGSWDH